MYNFTISEDTPLDQEVAVDPEMIGRVYESLVNIADDTSQQRDAGIFYTPRVEIDLMCRLAVIDWLKNRLGSEKANLLYQWVFAYTPEEKTAADGEIGAENLWPRLHDLLTEITVLDPSCGSGSFLVGMLYILNDLQARIDDHLGSDRTAYQRKKTIVGNSLYGVDIKSWAVHISELRLWLQLVVETEYQNSHERKLKPLLPNLTFKIRVGDSLVQQIGGIDLNLNRGRGQYAHQLSGRLTQLKAEKLKFFHNDPTCQYTTADMVRHEERRLFREMLAAQVHAKENMHHQLMIQLENPTDLFGKVTRPQLTLERPLAEQDAAQLKTDLADLRAAQAELDRVEQTPFVWDIAFVEIFEGVKKGFDIVVGNPPYLRQEEIHDPRLDGSQLSASQKRAYKDELEASVYAAWQKTFGFGSGEAKAGWSLSRRSDYYIYFYFLALSLLNSEGSFCFITSNAWLDVGYGEDLQKFLLTRGKIQCIIDNQVQRSFGRADINTVIVLLGAATDSAKPLKQNLDHLARFVMFRVPFDQALSPVIWQELSEQGEGRLERAEYRLLVRSQRTLHQAGITTSNGSYTADKWGGKYLRAPDIYWTILEKAGDKLVRLGDIAEVRFGIKTGANDFFYLDQEKIAQWGIEEEFLVPAVKSPKELNKLFISPADIKLKLFLCDKEKSGLFGTGALKYITFGESLKINKRPTCASRNLWWNLGNHISSAVNCNYLINKLMRFYFSLTPFFVGDNFQEIHTCLGADNISAACNCSLTQLLINIYGRSNFGGGLLKIQTFEISDLIVPNPSIYPDSIKSLMKEGGIFNIDSEERQQLDDITTYSLGLDKSFVKDISSELNNIVQKRLQKAESS